MKISTLIKALQSFSDVHGDLDIKLNCRYLSCDCSSIIMRCYCAEEDHLNEIEQVYREKGESFARIEHQ